MKIELHIHECTREPLTQQERQVVQSAIRAGIEPTWKRLVGTSAKFTIKIGNYLTHDGQRSEWLSSFDPDQNAMCFALDTIRDTFGEQLTLQEAFTLLAGHEITHVAQYHRGQRALGSMLNGGYGDDKDEHEAWNNAAVTFKGVFGTLGIWLEWGNGNRIDL